MEGGLNVMRNAFFKYESVAVACEVDQNPDAAKELEELTRRATRDGVSLAAIDKKTGTVVAAAFNKILVSVHNQSNLNNFSLEYSLKTK